MVNFALKHKKTLIWLFSLAIAFLYFAHIGSYHLIDPDEGRYHEIPREMIATGDYLTPKLNDVKYFEKPILQYWATAFFMKIFGVNEFAGRIFPALAALGTIALTGYTALKMYTPRIALLSAGVLATSLMTIVIASMNILDMGLTLFITACMVGYYYFERTGNKRWLYLFYISMGLGVLIKGLVAIILPFGILFWYLLLTKRFKSFGKVFYLPAIIAGLIVTVPWFYFVCKANPKFFYFFFIHEHFLRYTTKIHHRFQPWWFFIPFIFIGITPWTGFIASFFSKHGIIRHTTSSRNRQDIIYLLCWFLVILVFYSISDSKLVPYIMPCFIPLAILIAASIKRCEECGKWLASSLYINIIWSIFMGAVMLFVGSKYKDFLANEIKPSAYILGASFIILAILTGIAWKYFKRYRCTATSIFLLAFLVSFPVQGLQGAIYNSQSSYYISQKVLAMEPDNATLVNYAEYLHGLNFYTHKRVTLVNFKGELEFGSQFPGEEKYFLDNSQLKNLWNSSQRIIIIVSAKNLHACLQTITTPPKSIEQVGTQYILVNK